MLLRHTASFTAVLALVSMGACGGTTDSSSTNNESAGVVCTDGDTRACTGPGACEGGQFCSEGSWSACECAENNGDNQGGDGDRGGSSGDGDGDRGESSGDGDGSSGGTSGDGDAPSGGMSGDGDTSSGGNPSGGQTGSGGTWMIPDGDHPACDTTVRATGSPMLIDDFQGEGFPNIPDDDGRMGSWAHSNWLSPTGTAPDMNEDGMGGANGYLEAECLPERDELGDYPWCNSPWREFAPFEQWASIDLALVEFAEVTTHCYDASLHAGITFRARSATGGNSLKVFVNTPDANADTGETYQSQELSLSTEWQDFQIPFERISQPAWSTVTAPLNPRAIRAISWVVRTYEEQREEGMVVGWKLLPYNIQLDEVGFY